MNLHQVRHQALLDVCPLPTSAERQNCAQCRRRVHPQKSTRLAFPPSTGRPTAVGNQMISDTRGSLPWLAKNGPI
jgi:hypothetical protein